MKDREFLTLRETAQLLRVSPKTIWTWAKKDQIPYCRVGTRYRFEADAIIQWARDNDYPGVRHVTNG